MAEPIGKIRSVKGARRALMRWLFLFSGLFIVAFCLFWILFFQLRQEEQLLQTRNAALYSEMITFERATGYGGFIHNFKNAVLRPTETVYLDQTQADLVKALASLDRLEALVQDEEPLPDLAPIRETLLDYQQLTLVLAKTPPDALSARELDDVVRRPDLEAINALYNLVETARQSIDRRLEAIEARLFRVSAVSFVINTLLLAGTLGTFVLLRRREAEVTQLVEVAYGRVRAIFEAISTAVVAFDQNARIVVANRAAHEILDLPEGDGPQSWPSTLKFTSVDGLAPLEGGADPVQATFRGNALTGEVFAVRSEAASETRYFRITSRQVRPEPETEFSQMPIRAVIAIEDVTDQEAHRQKFERAARLDALGQLTGGIAHDFNNILASIMYAIELSLADPLPDKSRGWLTRAKGSVKRGSELAKRLLAFAKQQPGLSTSRPVAETLRDVEGLLRPTIEETISLTVDTVDDTLWARCDQAQLENAIVNLVLNARDAIQNSGKGNQIRISVRGVDRPLLVDPGQMEGADQPAAPFARPQHGRRESYDRYVEISITDNGPGMSSDVRRRAIDPFFTTKGHNAGSGLGLSIVYGFAQQSGGELRIYSEPQLGTTVRLLVPLAAPEHAPAAEQFRLPLPKGQSERILLVEDDAGLLAMVEDVLGSLGYRSVTARSGAEALKLVDDGEDFDVLLTDVVMPGALDGYLLAREVRSRRPDIPVIYMSGYAGVEEGNVGDVAGPWIQKPCTAAELARVLRSSLNSANRGAARAAKGPSPST